MINLTIAFDYIQTNIESALYLSIYDHKDTLIIGLNRIVDSGGGFLMWVWNWWSLKHVLCGFFFPHWATWALALQEKDVETVMIYKSFT